MREALGSIPAPKKKRQKKKKLSPKRQKKIPHRCVKPRNLNDLGASFIAILLSPPI
jgi:hypothetical protein